MAQPDSTLRFSDRVDHYVRYRPSYPAAVIGVLESDAGLTPASVIADVGSGTGISAELFLRHGNTVYGVEPNAPMRQAAERLLSVYPRFHSIEGTAEATRLKDASVDFVVAAQAFHWFDRKAASREFARILAPGGQVVLLWNSRRTDSTEFLRAYEDFLERHGTDYRQVNHRNMDEDSLRPFFRRYRRHVLHNEQELDLEGLKGRVLSSSYTPAPGHPLHRAMVEELGRLFERHQENGRVRIEYDTEVYFGEAASPD